VARMRTWQQQAGRALTQARPAGAILAVVVCAPLGGCLVGWGGCALIALLPCTTLGVLALRYLCSLPARAWLRAIGNAVIAVAVLTFWAAAVGPRLAGYETMTVLSTSMEPTYNPGDIILVTREPVADLRAGQIISFHVPTGDHHVVTHRVVTVQVEHGKTIVQTKGDDNTIADPWRAQLHGTSVWRYRMRFPYLGYPLLRLREPPVKIACLYGAPALLVLLLLGQIWLPKRLTTQRRLRHAHL